MKVRLNEHQEAVAHKAIMEKLWTEPLVGAYLDEFPVAKSSTVLVAEARCGYIPSKWVHRLSESTRIIALDPSRSMLDQARQRIDEDLQRRIFFVPQRINKLSYADGVFKGAVCLNGVSTRLQLQEGLSELARVVEPGGKLLLAVPTMESFPEMYDMFDEALRAHKLDDVASRLLDLRETFLRENVLLSTARELGLHDLSIGTASWEVAFDSGRDVLMSPLLHETFFSQWIGAIRSADREYVLRYIADAIDTYFHERTFTTSVQAACLICTR
ncbi:MAG: class I SAM-dependent methyltransferase [Myxococcota bacterium]|jgi:SAM-dependent methyltransferase|nr:class I SAM-dependent methyltransferase [Myxococcota bacterium]